MHTTPSLSAKVRTPEPVLQVGGHLSPALRSQSGDCSGVEYKYGYLMPGLNGLAIIILIPLYSPLSQDHIDPVTFSPSRFHGPRRPFGMKKSSLSIHK